MGRGWGLVPAPWDSQESSWLGWESHGHGFQSFLSWSLSFVTYNMG